jgi:hypothetical protein
MNLATIRYFQYTQLMQGLIKISDRYLRYSKQKSEMPALRKRGIMCSMEKKIYTHTTYFQIEAQKENQ